MQITVLTAIKPDRINKVYHSDGTKEAIANVVEAHAQSINVDTVDKLAYVLKEVSESTNKCLMPGVWHGDPNGRSFKVIPDGLFNYKFGHSAKAVKSDGHELVSSRKKDAIQQSSWILFDSDDPVGMPEWMRGLSLSDRMVEFDKVLPGLSQCERIELCGSSERVENYGSRKATHAWVRVSHPEMVEVMAAHLKIETSLRGLSFPSPRYSRETNEVIGSEEKTLFDLSVFVKGRIVFCARPTSELGAVYPANIRIVNRNGGILQIGHLSIPSKNRLCKFKDMTGKRVSISSNGTGVSIRNSTDLCLLTEIEVKGKVKPLMDWMMRMEHNNISKLRCESPFRASKSEAAVLFHTIEGTHIFDSGEQTTYFLNMEGY